MRNGRVRSQVVGGTGGMIADVCLCIFLAIPIVAAGAEELPRVAVLPLDSAMEAAKAAERQCVDDGHQVSVAVVDRSGVLQVLVRGDGAGPHTVDSSSRKAYTSASLRQPTRRLARMVADRPEISALGHMNESILLLGGGFPIRIEGDVVGGIGVGGAPGDILDEACARAGLAAIGADQFKED